MGLIYFFVLPAFESPGTFGCKFILSLPKGPFIVPNPDLAFAARLAIEFISIIP